MQQARGSRAVADTQHAAGRGFGAVADTQACSRQAGRGSRVG